MASRYLFCRLSALGDIVFALEALAAIRAAEPDAAVDWLVEDRGRDLVEGHPGIARVLVYPRRRFDAALRRPWRWPRLAIDLCRHVRTLRRERYDAVLDFQGNLKSAVQVRVARGRRRIGFGRPRARDASWLVYDERVAVGGRRDLHRAEQGRRLVAQLLGQAPTAAATAPLIPERAAAATRAAELLGPLLAADFVCLAPGTSNFAAFKRWPAARFAELAAALAADGVAVVVCTGPGEEALAEPILPHAALWFDGRHASLAVYLEILRRARVVVAADSGPLHFASAVGTAAVALFGPKDPAVYGPRGSRSVVLRYPVSCAPCGRRRCDAPLCVQGIPVAAVRAAVHELRDA